MSTEPCQHEQAFWADDGLWCPDCRCCIAVRCHACGGEGVVEEDEYECDWINYGSDLIVCPECGGTGMLRDAVAG